MRIGATRGGAWLERIDRTDIWMGIYIGEGVSRSSPGCARVCCVRLCAVVCSLAVSFVCVPCVGTPLWNRQPS